MQSEIGAPLEVGVRRGILMIASQQPNFWNENDLRFTEAVARWIGHVIHRAELAEEIAKNAVEQGRRAVAEELITVMAHDLRNYVARIDQGVLQIEPHPITLVALVEEIASALATPDHAIDVRSADEMVVVADPERLRQCLENLLSNAVKHSPSGAPVSVTVTRVSTERGELAQVAVIDEGPGVPPEVGARIFERFVTGKRSEGGLGLGLYLAKRIAVLHGGDLVFESPPGKGARFCLRLPILTGEPRSG